jgi:hypothetical protein
LAPERPQVRRGALATRPGADHSQLAARRALTRIPSGGVLFGSRLDVIFFGVTGLPGLGGLRLLVQGRVLQTATLRIGADGCAAFGTFGGTFRFVARFLFYGVALPPRWLVPAGLFVCLGRHARKLSTEAEVVNSCPRIDRVADGDARSYVRSAWGT